MEILIGVLGFIIGIIQTVFSHRQVKLAKLEVEISKRQEEKALSERDVYKRASEMYLKMFAESDDIFEDVDAATNKISEILIDEQNLSNKIELLNLGLDLEVVMPWLSNRIIEYIQKSAATLEYKGLIINPEYDKIVPLIDGTSNIHRKYIEAALSKAESLEFLPLNRIKIEIRSYSNLPHFHGFLINKRHLFIGFTEIENNKLVGGKYPYIYLLKNDKSRFSKHLFHVFQSWFEYTWKNSSSKVLIDKL